jgi:hypothetical protein
MLCSIPFFVLKISPLTLAAWGLYLNLITYRFGKPNEQQYTLLNALRIEAASFEEDTA